MTLASVLVPCDNCGRSDHDTVFVADGYPIVKCGGCGLLFVNPQPLPSAIVEHYQGDSHWGGEPQRGTEARSAGLYRQVLSLLPPRATVLDLGCSFGGFLEQLRDHGYQGVGIELSRAAAEVAQSKGFVVHQRPLSELAGLPPVDAITGLNVIEHFNKPREACRQMFDLLKPGGLVVLATPNTNFALPIVKLSTIVRRSRDISSGVSRKVSQLHPPNHLFFYTAGTLAALLRAGGFSRCHVTNAAPILNASPTRTAAKVAAYTLARAVSAVTAGHLTIGHSLVGIGWKAR